MELGVIHEMGFDAYFLIVWDLCKYAKEHGIWYNARGSVAGSIVGYALDISLVDPIEHDLIFERFLNTGRISMPDIDMDFQDDRRAEVMEYCCNKYGADKVSQIITFNTMGAKGAIRDVGRVMDIPLQEVNRVSKIISGISAKSPSLPEMLENSKELQELCASAPQIAKLLETAARMEGTIRSVGTHAAGVIITDQPITDYLPLHRPTNHDENLPIKSVAQYEMSVVDKLGLLKVDFLGLTTLTVMNNCAELIEAHYGKKYDIDSIPVNDPDVLAYLGSGHTSGVFQLESTGMTNSLKEMKPTHLTHVIAMIALYRPGPMQFISDYIKRMHGEAEISYRHEKMKKIFESTYGVAVYQEQIMQAARLLAGYSPNDADDLRSAIAKKKEDKIATHNKKFVEGAQQQGIDKNVAIDIFEDWKKFAHYGFTKSHAADYGVIAMKTAYLKMNYPSEYMAALLSAWKNNTSKMSLYVVECRAMGVEVLPPDVNASGYDFEIEYQPDGKGLIRFGLGGIKNVGQNPVNLILEARRIGPFKNLGDFVRRVDLRQVGSRPLECLIKVGALRAFGTRRALLQAKDRMISVSANHFKAVEVGQLMLFGSGATAHDRIELDDVQDISQRERLIWEKELMGLYVSDHPMNTYITAVKDQITTMAEELAEMEPNTPVVVAGMVNKIRPLLTKRNKSMAFVSIEDISGQIELVVFPKVWEKFRTLVDIDNLLIVEGKTDTERGEPKILADSIKLVDVEKLGEFFKQKNSPTLQDQVLGGYLPDISILASFVENNSESDAEDSWEDIDELPDISDDLQGDSDPIIPVDGMDMLTSEQAVGAVTAPRQHQPSGKKIIVTLSSCGNKAKDKNYLKRIYGLLLSNPGNDRFAYRVLEKGQYYLLEFPNSSTCVNELLLSMLKQMVGEENFEVISCQAGTPSA